jgi:hypothetical protein
MPAAVTARAARADIPPALDGTGAAVGDADGGCSVPAPVAGGVIAAMPAALRCARAEVAGAVRAAVRLGEVIALPGEAAALPGEVAVVPGRAVVPPAEVVMLPGEVPVPPAGTPALPGATAGTVPRTWVRTEVTGAVTPLAVLAPVVTTAWPVLSSWVTDDVAGVLMLLMVPPSEVTAP